MKCSICKGEIEVKKDPKTGKVFWDQGNNAQPINDGRCCDKCDLEVVIPKRIEKVINQRKAVLKVKDYEIEIIEFSEKIIINVKGKTLNKNLVLANDDIKIYNNNKNSDDNEKKQA